MSQIYKCKFSDLPSWHLGIRGLMVIMMKILIMMISGKCCKNRYGEDIRMEVK